MADAKEPPASGRVWEVDYFPKAGPRQLADCLDRDYARVLVDYGEFTGESLLECTRCDQKIIVGSFTEWQAEAFLDVMCRERKRDGSWSYAAAFGSEEARREAERRFRIPVRRIPFSSDAFAVTRADMRFFSELLGDRAGRR